MVPRERRLPLFPLNVVLFPNAMLPLHVFEERYKSMVSDCLDSDSRFGVVLIKSGAEVGEAAMPHPVGTVAQIERVNRLDDGRMILNVAGRERFKIKELFEDRPYLSALVELLEEDSGAKLPDADMEAVRKAASRHVKLLLGLRGGWVHRPQLPDDPVALSYFIAPVLQVGLGQKQGLLQEPSAIKRLQAERRLLETEVDALDSRMNKDFRRRFGRQ